MPKSHKIDAEELMKLANHAALANAHDLKSWSIWPGCDFYLAECKLCGANALADPTLVHYPTGIGGGAVQFRCRSASQVAPSSQSFPAAVAK